MSKPLPTRIFKKFTASVAANSGERAVVATVSTSAIDRDFEVVVASGVNSKQYEENAILLWQHDYNTPIGKCVSLKRQTDSIICKFVFPPRPDTIPDTQPWFPDEVFALYQAGVLSAFSIGFIVNESRMPTKADLGTYGPEVQRVLSKVTLIEISCVTIPANSDAIALAVSKGLLTQQKVDSIFNPAFPNRSRQCAKCNASQPEVEMTKWGQGKYLCSTCGAVPTTCKSCLKEFPLSEMVAGDDDTIFENLDCSGCAAEADEETGKRFILVTDSAPRVRYIIHQWNPPRMKINPKAIEHRAKAKLAKLRGRITLLDEGPPLMIPADDDGGEQ